MAVKEEKENWSDSFFLSNTHATLGCVLEDLQFSVCPQFIGNNMFKLRMFCGVQLFNYKWERLIYINMKCYAISSTYYLFSSSLLSLSLHVCGNDYLIGVYQWNNNIPAVDCYLKSIYTYDCVYLLYNLHCHKLTLQNFTYRWIFYSKFVFYIYPHWSPLPCLSNSWGSYLLVISDKSRAQNWMSIQIREYDIARGRDYAILLQNFNKI